MLTALRRGSAAVGGQKNPKTRIRTDRTRPLGTKGPQGSLFVVVYALYGVWGVLSDWQSQPGRALLVSIVPVDDRANIDIIVDKIET